MRNDTNVRKMPDNIPPFVKFCCANVPAVFDDSLSYYEALCALWKYLQDCIDVINNNALLEEEFIEKFNLLKDYVENYFDNLDVQNEINVKLDEMARDGSLQTIFANYINPVVEGLETRVDGLQAQLEAFATNPPVVVTSAGDMTDHDKIYVLTTDNKWYYWNGSAWTVGGSFISDASIDTIDYYTKTTNTGTSANMLNPYTCLDNKSIASADGSVSTNNSYWITDFIPIDNTKYWIDTANNAYYYGQVTAQYEKQGAYKIVYYDSSKQFLYVDSQSDDSGQRGIRTNSDKMEFQEDVAYCRLQFKKSVVSFDSRNNFVVELLGENYTLKDLYTSNYAVSHYNIIKGEVHNTKLNDGARQSVMASGFEKGINPFDISDFSNIVIKTADGSFEGGSNSRQRLSTNNLIFVPAGTSVSVSSGWLMLALEYSKNDVYQGRFASDWDSEIFFQNDAYVRFTFKSDPATELLALSSVQNLIESISVEHKTSEDDPQYFYSGEKITLNNSFSATSTGLKTKHQDGAISGDTIIEIGSDGTYFVQDIQGNILQSSTNLDQYSTIAPHANSVCFGVEKYQSSDNYPVFYANAYNNADLPKGTCYVYRLKNDYLTTLLQTIRIGFTDETIWTGGGVNIRPYGNFVVDTDNNKLYVFTLIDNLNVTRFFEFDLPELSDGANVTLNTSDINRYFDVPYMPYIQGVCYHDGKIYALAGNNSIVAKSSKLNVVDLTKEATVSSVYLGYQFTEPETIFIKDNTAYIGMTKLYAYQF